jgi:gamma-glutamyl-gamma-aminobutyrate hydrolase PuuD
VSAADVLVTFRYADKAGPYLAALQAAGLHPVECTPGSRRTVEGVQGVVFTGGSDVRPSYYGQEPHAHLGEVDEQRDAFELDLMTMADAADLPVLCICRGLQLLNVHRGGTLVQHLPQAERHRRTDTAKCEAVHWVRIEPGSKLGTILGTGETQVNSRHHQAVDRIGEGLVVTARDVEDGVIEAVEDPSRRFVVAVQWHPEDQAPGDEVQRRLFSAFANEVLLPIARKETRRHLRASTETEA